jgi:uncharacterized protein (DUF2342 family)
MRHVMNFHPEWGCLAPAPSFIRTVFVATAVGAVAGGGAVLSFADHLAEGQASVAERTLGRPIAPVSNSVSAPQTNQQTINRRESAEISWADGHVNDPASAELNASSPERPAVVAASTVVRMGTGGASAKTAFTSSPTVQIRTKHGAQTARHKNFVSSSRAPQHSLAPRTDPNTFQRFWAGVTTAIEHVWPLATSPSDRTSRAHGANVSPA